MIPNLYAKEPIPDFIPVELSKKIKLFSKNKNKEEFLKKAFIFLANKHKGSKFNFFLKLRRAFIIDLQVMLNLEGYLHCTNRNFLLRVMIVKSGLFKEEDVILKKTNIWWFFPHQYLSIRLSKNRFIDVDLWGYQNGVEYGSYDCGFKNLNFFPRR